MSANTSELAPADRRLLDYLRARPNRVHGRDALLREVWGDAHTTPRSVDASIARLRRSLGAGGTAIVTVRRVGYRLDPERLDPERLEPGG